MSGIIAPLVEGRREASEGRAWIALVGLGAALEAVCVACAAVAPGRDGVLPALVLFFAAALLYLAAVALVVSRDAAPARVSLVFAVLFRLTLVFTPPVLTTDLARYSWEGRVTASGRSPYALAPAAAELAPLRDDNWTHVEHRAVPAVYGPLAELAFVVQHPLALKALFAVADLGALLVLARLLARRGQGKLAIAYAWHPLVLVEVAGQGHVDALLVLFLLLAILCEEARPRLAAALLALGAGVKYLPVLLLPALVRRRWTAAPAFAVTFLACALPFVLLDPRPPQGVATYATEWRFNATGYLLLEAVLSPLAARVAAGLIVTGVALATTRRGLATAAFAVIATTLLLAPAVHPWYFLWLVPFAVLRRDAALLAVTLAVPVTYEVLLRYDGTHASWEERAWPRALLAGAYLVSSLALRCRKTGLKGKR